MDSADRMDDPEGGRKVPIAAMTSDVGFLAKAIEAAGVGILALDRRTEGVVYVNAAGAVPQINGDEYFELKDDTSAVVDGPTYALSASGGESYQRIGPDETAAGGWSVVGDSAATPGTVTYTGGVMPIFISEISDATGTGAYVYEFVELYCAGS